MNIISKYNLKNTQLIIIILTTMINEIKENNELRMIFIIINEYRVMINIHFINYIFITL